MSFEKNLTTKKQRCLASGNEPAVPKCRINMAGAVITGKEMSSQIIQKAKDDDIKKMEIEKRREATNKKK